MAQKAQFLLKNTAGGPGLYRVNGKDFTMQPGDQIVLDFPPELHSVELKLVEIKQ